MLCNPKPLSLYYKMKTRPFKSHYIVNIITACEQVNIQRNQLNNIYLIHAHITVYRLAQHNFVTLRAWKNFLFKSEKENSRLFELGNKSEKKMKNLIIIHGKQHFLFFFLLYSVVWVCVCWGNKNFWFVRYTKCVPFAFSFFPLFSNIGSIFFSKHTRKYMHTQ